MIFSQIFGVIIAATTITAMGGAFMPPLRPRIGDGELSLYGNHAGGAHDTVKVLINTCYGGFAFSDAFCAEYNRIYGEGAMQTYMATHFYDAFLEKNRKLCNGKVASRYDPKIVELYERLGGSYACSGKYATLKTVEIPRALAPYITIKETYGDETIAIHISQMYRDLLDDIVSRRCVRFCDTMAYEEIRNWEKYLSERKIRFL